MIATWQFQIDDVEHWAYWDNVFTPEECAQIIQIGNTKLEPAKICLGDSKTIRESQISWLGPQDIKFAYEKIAPIVCSLNERFFKFDLFGMAAGIQFTRYDSPTGYYGMHIDKLLHSEIRKLSLTIQLSSPDDYEGGELALQHSKDPTVMSKEQGKMIIFPSYMLHEVRPVTKGTRYSLVAWITGKPFK
jgi:PKHD-type hydroxylase